MIALISEFIWSNTEFHSSFEVGNPCKNIMTGFPDFVSVYATFPNDDVKNVPIGNNNIENF